MGMAIISPPIMSIKAKKYLLGLQRDLYKLKTKTIPDSFKSVDEYLQRFVLHLLVETQIELSSSFKSLSKTPVFQIKSVQTQGSNGKSLMSKWFYDIERKDSWSSFEKYQPKCEDLIALTNERPRGIDDLNSVLLAYVLYSGNIVDLKTPVCSSRSISDLEKRSYQFGVYLMNLTTDIRIWNALHNEAADSTLIKSVLQGNTLAIEQCGNSVEGSESVLDIISSSKLNPSQEAAILSCLKTRNCNHNQSVKLIWGPPGTDKTKTIATLFFALLKLKCRTVVCAPTNIAIVEVTSRLLSLLQKTSSSEYVRTGLGILIYLETEKEWGLKGVEFFSMCFLMSALLTW